MAEMTRTPDDIKKGLIEPELFCDHCDWYGEPNGCNNPNGPCKAWDNADDAYHLIQQLEAERNQAVEDLRYIGKLRENNCTFCLYYNHGDGSKECIRCGMFGEDHWQWRGVPEREG